MKVRIAIVMLGLIAGSALAYLDYSRLHEDASSLSAYFDVDGPEYADTVLTTHNGNDVRWRDFANKHRLVYFGYGSCPDICPLELFRISRVLKKINANTKQIQPIFITVDPARDTAEFLSEYLGYFHPDLVGLTGEKAAIDKMATAFKVFYDLSKRSSGSDFYLVNHTSAIFYVDPGGEVKEVFASEISDDEIEKAISRVLNG